MESPAVKKKHYYSFEEYLQLEEQEHIRHEYHNGEIFAMAGGSMNHSDIADNIKNIVKAATEERGCRTFQADIKVQSVKGASYFYPDVVVTCSAADIKDGYLIRNPLLIAEVLSPSTEAYDRGTKSIMYRRIPSLRYYLLVSQTEPLVQVYSRAASTALFLLQDFSSIGDVISFPDLDFSMSLQQIYRRIRFEDLPENPAGMISL